MTGAEGECGLSAKAHWHLTGLTLQEDSCPQFLDPSPLVIPMNHETEVAFQGKNLDTVQVGLPQRPPTSRCPELSGLPPTPTPRPRHRAKPLKSLLIEHSAGGRRRRRGPGPRGGSLTSLENSQRGGGPGG